MVTFWQVDGSEKCLAALHKPDVGSSITHRIAQRVGARGTLTSATPQPRVFNPFGCKPMASRYGSEVSDYQEAVQPHYSKEPIKEPKRMNKMNDNTGRCICQYAGCAPKCDKLIKTDHPLDLDGYLDAKAYRDRYSYFCDDCFIRLCFETSLLEGREGIAAIRRFEDRFGNNPLTHEDRQRIKCDGSPSNPSDGPTRL